MYIIDFKDKLNINNPEYRKLLLDYFLLQLKFDAIEHDKAAELFIGAKSSAQIVARNEFFLSGSEEVSVLLEAFKDLKVTFNFNDGDLVLKDSIIALVNGPADQILKAERTLLNFLSQMSAVATKSAKYVKVLGDFKNPVKIASTRKGMFSKLNKKAASSVGVLTHRLDLGTGYMLKDNHYALNKHSSLVDSFELDYLNFIELEYDSSKQLFRDLDRLVLQLNGKNWGILLDNFSPELLKDCLNEIAVKFADRKFFIEASGGINLKNLTSYDLANLDYISSSDLFFPDYIPDLSLELESK